MNDIEVIERVGKNNLITIDNAVKKGHSLGMMFIEENKILKMPSAYSLRQNIINLYIDYALERICDNVNTDYRFRYNFNHKKNCQHIELFKDDVVLTHSSGNVNKFPREAKFRNDLCTNMISLFPDNILQYEMRYGIIMHSSSLQEDSIPKVSLGIPDADCKKWCNYINLGNIDKGIFILDNNDDDEEFNFEMKKRIEKTITQIG